MQKTTPIPLHLGNRLEVLLAPYELVIRVCVFIAEDM